MKEFCFEEKYSFFPNFELFLSRIIEIYLPTFIIRLLRDISKKVAVFHIGSAIFNTRLAIRLSAANKKFRWVKVMCTTMRVR